MTEQTFPAMHTVPRPPLPAALRPDRKRRDRAVMLPRRNHCPRCRSWMGNADRGDRIIEGGPSGVPGEVICNVCYDAMCAERGVTWR